MPLIRTPVPGISTGRFASLSAAMTDRAAARSGSPVSQPYSAGSA
jgi:hypothetical protein